MVRLEWNAQHVVALASIGGTIAGAAFALARRALDLVESSFSRKSNGNGVSSSSSGKSCPFGPEQAETWHDLREDARRSREMLSSAVPCPWKDRDEVIGHKASLDRNTEAVLSFRVACDQNSAELARLNHSLATVLAKMGG